MNIQQMNAAWAQMRRASTLAAYARMAAEAAKRHSGGGAGHAEAEEPPKEEPKAEEPVVETPPAEAPSAETPAEVPPAEEPKQEEETPAEEPPAEEPVGPSGEETAK